jgi:hypothetical protein
MNTKDDGGPAFPHVREWFATDTYKELTGGGMTLRDYFAAKAMQASLHVALDHSRLDMTAKMMADTAYEMADAMLKARSSA